MAIRAAIMQSLVEILPQYKLEHYMVVSQPIRLAETENMDAGIISDSLKGLLGRIFFEPIQLL